ncbi:type IV pilus modification PilV family protein [Massilia horti]|uniref:Type II secretion system protein n=1 Tax=Massilia horti TaxID=2562153 RepID=A0A4Y9SWL7_9BURK|nr:type II secretion system protein [Massilia horti]TFW30985.1 type II secretion system protein [Massilia horti]
MYSEPLPRRPRGVTLVEMILFIIIVGIALAGIIQVLGFTGKNSADPVRRKQALMIAEGLLEEVQQAKFTFCDVDSANADSATSAAECAIPAHFGHAAGAARPFESITSYVTAAGTSAAAFDVNGRLSDANGNPIDVNGYTASLTITAVGLGPANAAIGATGTSPDADVLRIRVEVSYDGQTLVLDGYRARYAPTIQ